MTIAAYLTSSFPNLPIEVKDYVEGIVIVFVIVMIILTYYFVVVIIISKVSLLFLVLTRFNDEKQIYVFLSSFKRKC